jgi:DNA-binding response OmpR family regulator
VLSTGSGAEAISLAASARPDLVILDLGLPDVPGESVAREIRSAGSTPILMLTARSGEEDRIGGLELGADDYVTKPFSPRELALRVRSVLRRVPAPATALPLEISTGDLTVSTAARAVHVAGQPVNLTNREFDLLLFFLTHADAVFSREELLKRVWRWEFGDLSTVTVHVKRLRAKLGDHHSIQTVWGRGYLWQDAR